MKEIRIFVWKLSCEQKSTAGEDGAGGMRRRRTNQYKNIKPHPVYWGDLIILGAPQLIFLDPHNFINIQPNNSINGSS